MINTVLLFSIAAMTETNPLTLEAIAALAELPRRTVRYYIQIGLIDRPEGIGKGAYYTQRHLEQLLLVRKWQLAGLSLERISDLLRQQDTRPLPPTPRRPGTVEVWSHLVVAEGVELMLDPGRAGLSPEQVRAFFQTVSQALSSIQESEKNS